MQVNNKKLLEWIGQQAGVKGRVKNKNKELGRKYNYNF